VTRPRWLAALAVGGIVLTTTLLTVGALALLGAFGGRAASGNLPGDAGGGDRAAFDTRELEHRVEAEFVRRARQSGVDTTVTSIDCPRPNPDRDAGCLVYATGFAAYGSLADPDPATGFNVEVRCSGQTVDGCEVTAIIAPD
jgi:hypothetical protein